MANIDEEGVSTIVRAFQDTAFEEIPALVSKSIDSGGSATSILEDGLTKGLREIGDRFSRGELYLPEMMMAADAWKRGVAILDPLLASSGYQQKPMTRVVIGTVKGDIHSLGRQIVTTLLRTAGCTVIDIGEDAPASRFVQEAEDQSADIIAASALMTTTMPQQREIMEHLRARGRRQDFFVIVGGGCTTQEWADEIGADGYGETAADAVSLMHAFVKEGKGEAR